MMACGVGGGKGDDGGTAGGLPWRGTGVRCHGPHWWGCGFDCQTWVQGTSIPRNSYPKTRALCLLLAEHWSPTEMSFRFIL